MKLRLLMCLGWKFKNFLEKITANILNCDSNIFTKNQKNLLFKISIQNYLSYNLE